MRLWSPLGIEGMMLFYATKPIIEKNMPIHHILLALIVVLIWGINFIFVKIGLKELSPLMLCATRFLLASVPAVFFIKPPRAPFQIVAAYGLIMFALQFSLIFLGIHFGMTAGMASVIMQVQVFFSMLFAALLLKDIPKLHQLVGAMVSFLGILIVAVNFDYDVTLAGFLCLLGGAATWGFGNLIIRKHNNLNMMSLVVWGSLIACIPMLSLSLYFEGTTKLLAAWHDLSWEGYASIAYIVYASTWVGYGLWNWLLSRYSVGTIVPFNLLVPIVGLISSAIFLGEPLQGWKVWAGLLVIGGLGLNLVGNRIGLLQTLARSR